ncbi:MAG: GFA family protein [Pseudomonadales bacterium]|jgi:hypothetical protein|nr:GFA family protein [Pseudomonadales bacterium]
MSDTTTYTGACHCGKVQFDVNTKLEGVMSCNCSHCARKGFLLAFVPAEQFTLRSGANGLTEYRFNKHVIAHQFCSTCGTQAFAHGVMPDGSAVCAVNVRCLDGVDVDALPVQKVDGKSL